MRVLSRRWQAFLTWCRRKLAIREPIPAAERELVKVGWGQADLMLRDESAGWRLAPEEDTNQTFGTVYLERRRRDPGISNVL